MKIDSVLDQEELCFWKGDWTKTGIQQLFRNEFMLSFHKVLFSLADYTVIFKGQGKIKLCGRTTSKRPKH